VWSKIPAPISADRALTTRLILTTRKGDASPSIDGFRAALREAIGIAGAGDHSLTQTLVSSV